MKRVFVSAAIHRVKRERPWKKDGPINGWQAEIVVVEEREGTDGSVYHSDETVTVWWPEYEKLLAYLQATFESSE